MNLNVFTVVKKLIKISKFLIHILDLFLFSSCKALLKFSGIAIGTGGTGPK